MDGHPPEGACPLCGAGAEPTVLGSTAAYRCPSCQLLSLAGVHVPEGYYDDYFDRFRSERSAPAAVLRDEQYQVDARHLRGVCPGGRVLDVGCSAGGFLAAVDGLGTDFTRFVGIDPDHSAVARARALEFRAPATFHSGDLLDFEALPDSFDAIVFRGTLQYVGPTLNAVLARVDALLAPGGHVFFYALPNADSFLFHLFADRWHLFHPLEHRLIFSRASMAAMARRMAWTLVEVSYPYLETPYAAPVDDYRRVVEMIRSGNPGPVPFWGNLLQVVMRAPE